MVRVKTIHTHNKSVIIVISKIDIFFQIVKSQQKRFIECLKHSVPTEDLKHVTYCSLMISNTKHKNTNKRISKPVFTMMYLNVFFTKTINLEIEVS